MQRIDVRTRHAPLHALEIPPAEQLHASAVAFLLEGDDEEAADVLLGCSLSTWPVGQDWIDEGGVQVGLRVELAGPREVYEVLRDGGNPVTVAIREAIAAVLPAYLFLDDLSVRAELVDVDPGWRRRLLEAARGDRVHNQAGGNGATHVWHGLRFRSHSEVCIAQALDRAGVMYLANCLARLGPPPDRLTREADFLVCCDGRWGILEVDGEPFHPATRAAEDHERDRLFRLQGVSAVEHFDAGECRRDADGVVRRFLEVLEKTVSP
jgi:hypothetical protein